MVCTNKLTSPLCLIFKLHDNFWLGALHRDSYGRCSNYISLHTLPGLLMKLVMTMISVPLKISKDLVNLIIYTYTECFLPTPSHWSRTNGLPVPSTPFSWGDLSPDNLPIISQSSVFDKYFMALDLGNRINFFGYLNQASLSRLHLKGFPQNGFVPALKSIALFTSMAGMTSYQFYCDIVHPNHIIKSVPH